MKLQLKRSNVIETGSAKQPTAAQLEFGELAVNYNTEDPAIFLKDSANNVIRISGVNNISDDGLVNVPSGTTAPLDPEEGNLWFNSDEGRLYIYYVDPDTAQWVDASPDSYNPAVIPDLDNPDYQPGTLDDRYNSSEVQETPPNVDLKNEGALWWNSQDGEGQLYVLYNDPAPDGRKKWVEASPHPDVTGFIRSADGGTQQSITGGGGLDVEGPATFDNALTVDRTTETDVVLQGKLNNSAATSKIRASGAAEFASDVDVSNGYANGNGITLQSGGQVRVRGDNLSETAAGLAIYRNGTGGTNIKARINFDGSAKFTGSIDTGGVSFNGDTAAENTLNDYEEGTWTPTVGTGTLTFADAKYIRIGRLVTIQAQVTNFSERSAFSRLEINGMPYVVGASSSAAGACMVRFSDTQANCVYVEGDGVFFYQSSSGSWDSLDYGDLNDPGASIYFMASYFTTQ